MRFATSLVLLSIAGASGSAWAGPALEDDNKTTPTPTTDPAVAPTTPLEDKVIYGVDFRLRQVYLPSSEMGLFVDTVPGGTSHGGWGFDFVRRHGTVELQLGFEHEQIEAAEGVWIEKGKTVPGDSVDYILSPQDAPNGESFGWYTLEFTFLNHAPINKYVSFRYGAGAGLGILSGSVYRWDVTCAAGSTNTNTHPGCEPPAKGGTGTTLLDNSGAPETTPQAYNLPPVFPVVNVIVGLQIRPIEHLVINVEGGLRTLPFLGLSVGYYM